MRTLLLLATAALPLAAPHALEAVAQSPVGGGSSSGAGNLANNAKISAVKAESAALKQTVAELKTELKNVTDCAASGQLWNGSACVAINGQAGKDGTQITIPTCTASQTLVSYDGNTLNCVAQSQQGDITAGWCFTNIPCNGAPSATAPAVVTGNPYPDSCGCQSGWTKRITGGYYFTGSCNGPALYTTCVKN